MGDSKEQNGSFNIALNQAKQDLLNFKEEKCLPGSLSHTDLMPIINKAWDKSFARIRHNKNAIADRGWNPLNYNLLLNPEIRATMTKQDQKHESSSDDIILPSVFTPDNTSIRETNSESNRTRNNDIDESSIQSSLKISYGTSSFCLKAILKQEQLQEARERIKEEKDEGESVLKRLQQAKRITAGICYKIGTSRLGKNVFNVCKEREINKLNELMSKVEEQKIAILH